jgi:O-antigen ligase
MMLELFKYGILAAAIGATTFSKRWGLAAFAFFLPLTQWLPDIPVPGLNAINLMLLPLLARAVLAGPDRREPRHGEPLFFPIAIVVVFTTIAWVRVYFFDLLPQQFLDEGGFWANFVTFKEILLGFVFYFCSRRLTRDADQRRRAIAGIAAGYGFEATTAAREFLFSGSWRATGHMLQPNKLGDFIAGYVTLPTAFLFGGGGYFLLALSGVAIGILGLFGAVSRGAILATALAIGLMALVRRSVWIVVVAAAVVSSPIWLPEKVMDRFASTVVDEGGGDKELNVEHEGRFELWQMANLMIHDHPVLGVGLNMFGSNLRPYGYQGRRLRSTHNIYLQFSVEQGIPCAVGHVLLFLTLMWIALRVALAHPGPFERVIGLAMFGMLVGFAAGSFFGDGFYENNLSGLFFLMAGIVVNLSHELADLRRAEPTRPMIKAVA